MVCDGSGMVVCAHCPDEPLPLVCGHCGGEGVVTCQGCPLCSGEDGGDYGADDLDDVDFELEY